MSPGALIIKERLKLTDEETVEQIWENPYLQYFIGMKEYSGEKPFDSSLMVHFRNRIGIETLLRVNESICSPKKNQPEPGVVDVPRTRGHEPRVSVPSYSIRVA